MQQLGVEKILDAQQKAFQSLVEANNNHVNEADRLTNTTGCIERVTCTQRELEDGIDYVENQTDGVTDVAAET